MGIPSAFLNIEGTQTYASVYEATKHLLLSLRGHVSSFTNAFSVKFLAMDEELVLDDSHLVQEPTLQRYQAHQLAISAGIYDGEHAREKENIKLSRNIEAPQREENVP